jgi:hypothetical protein
MSHEGVKCTACVLLSLAKKDIEKEPQAVQNGVDAAEAAVIVYGGESLCVEHLRERLLATKLKEQL